MNTLLLDQTRWDLVLDAAGNIAMATEPYAIAQDVASAIRLFRGELYYNTVPGVPYFEQILGNQPSISFMKAQFVKAALTVPGVVAATCFISAIDDRTLHGQIQVTATDGVITNVPF